MRISMVTLRLQRIGRKNQPHFRVVATDARYAPKSGKFIEIVGSYNPKAGEKIFKEDRVKHWLAQGATVSDTVHNFLIDAKLMEGTKIIPTRKKKEDKK
jgi:small subunit ribosomal protein S16